MTPQPRRAALLDRDNTLIFDPGYLSDPAQVRLLDGVIAGLHLLDTAGYALVIVSNQSGVGRGYFTATEVALVQARLEALLADHRLTLAGAFYCYHHPSSPCECRKPAPGLLVQAAETLHLDLAASVMIGDKPSDTTAGKRAGCRAVLVESGRADERTFGPDDLPPDAICPDFLSAAQWAVMQQDAV